MNGWKVLAPISSIAIALAAGHACSRGSEQDPTTNVPITEVDQLADGCGAWRYRGSASLECNYQADVDGGTFNAVGTCIDEEYLSCAYPIKCRWLVAEVITACVAGAGACSALPPSFPLAQPEPTILELPEGSQVCVDGQSTAAGRSDYCWRNSDGVRAAATQFCQAQFSHESGTTTCCLSCGPQLRASTTCDGGECTCSMPDGGTPDAGTGSDGGSDPEPDAGVDGGSGSDGGSGPEPDAGTDAGSGSDAGSPPEPDAGEGSGSG